MLIFISIILIAVLGVGLILVVLHVDGVLPLTIHGVLVHANCGRKIGVL